jgi:homoserine kinase type II
VALLTPLDPARVAAVAAAFDLGRIADVAPLWAGTINSNFRLETSRGRLFLRINEGKAEEDVAYEAELLAHLARAGVRTPEPLGAGDGRRYAAVDGRFVTLFPWLPGAHRDPPAPDDCRALGGALAALHRAGAGFPRRRESRYSRQRIAARLRSIPAPPPELGAELARLASWDPPDDGVIHGDLFPDNVLWSDGPWLLDFEQASDGSFVYDLAVCLLSWCWDGSGFDRARWQALLAGYGPVDPDALRDAARFAAVRFTVTRLTDVELDPRAPPELKKIKDYRDFLARLRVLRSSGV